ncbi:hypothetical protein Pcinc_017649 [Petrolisthes cinctipes]|uniref:Aminotransferase class I/classII large domain-containing protein n=1 Tax=Petrolisthes cinctipes TaxID=88211 RepID=A0AAE1KPN5_PETCI|nr:hypothetical protein Pcinc_017649 [Petrolisthes cinctipes]
MAKILEKVLSKRGAKTASHDDFLIHTLLEVAENPFHPTDNPKGIVNLGTAFNALMSDKLCERMRQRDALDIQPHLLQYFDMTGTPELKEAMVAFFNRHFHPHVPVLPSQVVVMSGVTSCLDALGHALCDPGDIIITPTPVYGRIITDFRDVTEINMDYLNLSEGEEDSDTGNGFTLRVEDVENRINSLKEQGLRVGAVILLNPHNPLGDVYPPHFLLRLLDVCAQHKIHAIVDEVYALSVFKEGVEFHSVLSLDVPDPRRTHVLWGMSKDFGNPGMLVGVVVTRSKEVLACLQNSSVFKAVPSVIQQAATVILNDIAWSDEYFLPTKKQQLRAAFEYARERLDKMGVIVRDSSAGLFIWFSVQRFLKHKTEEEELALHKELLEAGVYTVPGVIFYCITPGWMRIVFSTGHQDLKEGLDRLEMVLKRREPHNTNGILHTCSKDHIPELP